MPDPIKSDILLTINPLATRSEQLVLRAEALAKDGGENRLTADERRDALAYLMGVRPDMSNYQLGVLFGVSEGQIRKDKEIVRKRMADEINADDISLVVTDLRRHYENCRIDLARSCKACNDGTAVKLAHIKALWDLDLQMTEALQSLGYLPKNLGNMTKQSFVYKAHVAKGGGVNTTQIADDKELKTIEAQEFKLLGATAESEEDAAIRANLEEQFSETPRNTSEQVNRG